MARHVETGYGTADRSRPGSRQKAACEWSGAFQVLRHIAEKGPPGRYELSVVILGSPPCPGVLSRYLHPANTCLRRGLHLEAAFVWFLSSDAPSKEFPDSRRFMNGSQTTSGRRTSAVNKPILQLFMRFRQTLSLGLLEGLLHCHRQMSCRTRPSTGSLRRSTAACAVPVP